MLRPIIIRVVVSALLVFSLSLTGHAEWWKKFSKKERPTFEEIRKGAGKYFKNRKEDSHSGYNQYKRWEWFAHSRLDKEGYFSPQLKWQGWQEKQQRFTSTGMASGTGWQAVGPFNLAVNIGGAGMGRLNCIEFDPQDHNIIWVGAPTGGLWRSTDGGLTWATFTDALPGIGVSDIAIHPEKPEIMYIATGDKGRCSTLSVGIFKSTDRGLSWQVTGLNPAVQEQSIISKLLIHPSNPDTLFTATNKGIYKTDDAGANWVLKSSGDFTDMEVKTSDSSVWYAGRAGYGVYRSTDSGENWNRLSAGLPFPDAGIGRVVVTLSPAAPHIVYALYSQEVEGQGWEWGLYGIYRSTDGGDSWSLQASRPNLLGWETNGSDAGGQGGYALVFQASPADPNVLFAGSVNLWKSTDGGLSWQYGNGRDDSFNVTTVHVDFHELVFLPGSSTTMFACHDGGLHRSVDGGANWTDLSNGLNIHQVYRMGLGVEKPGHMVLGLQDNGSELFNGTWRSVSGGDGAECMIDPEDSTIVYCASQWGRFLRSVNEGRQFNRIFLDIAGGGGRAWMAPLVMDPTSPSTLYTTTGMVWRSLDRGDTSTAISPLLSNDALTVLAVAPSNPDTIYTTDGERLFRTSDGGNEWNEMDTSAFGALITDIAVHPFDPEKVWLTFGGYGRWNSRFKWLNIKYEIDKEKVAYSKDGGLSWTDISGQLPNIPANCMIVDTDTLGIYLGTDLGVFYCDSMGNGENGVDEFMWQRYDTGLPNVIITDMEIQRENREIVVATYGRGVWKAPLAEPKAPPALYPPLRFTGSSKQNRSLFQREAVNVLEWKANWRNEGKVNSYRIYRALGNDRILLGEVSGGTFQFAQRGEGQGPTLYAVTAVNGSGNESEGVYLTLRPE